MIQIISGDAAERSAAFRPLLLAFRSDGEIFGVDRRHEGHEDFMIVARETMIAGILAYGLVGDRAFAAKCPIEAIMAKTIPRSKVEVEPYFVFGLISGILESRLRPTLFGVGGGNLGDPRIRFGRLLPQLSGAKRLDQFPTALSTNSISISATRAAALSTSARRVR